jgi:hypothetical protein
MNQSLKIICETIDLKHSINFIDFIQIQKVCIYSFFSVIKYQEKEKENNLIIKGRSFSRF